MGFSFTYGTLTKEQLEARALDENGHVPDLLAIIVQIDVALKLAAGFKAEQGRHAQFKAYAIGCLDEAKDQFMRMLPNEDLRGPV